MINRYSDYLIYIDSKLSKMFSEQAPYIKCKKGCAYCCKEGIFPISELEYIYLMNYLMYLNEAEKNIVLNNIETLISKDINGFYACPFLVDDECSVYSVRPIICRTFGLIYYTKNKKNKIPFCVDIGLNYSEVFDEATSTLNSLEGFPEPIAYNIDRNVMRSKQMEDLFNIYFGEDKSLLDWIKLDFSNQ